MLDKFNPKQLKSYNKEQLEALALEIRTFLIENISKTGGHLGSNLGVVELTIMLHKIFNSPNDKIIFDVGHQGYVHKILTGRSEYFNTLRQTDGLSGFLKRKESIHDVWEAGHSSTSVSAACGFALARDLNHQDSEVICIIGDGSLTNGMSLEALNHLSSLNTKVIIILNDNEMSISKNVGFIDNILKNIQISQSYNKTKQTIKKVITALPYGDHLANKVSFLKEEIKNKISPSQSFFNLMGFDYIGLVNGHDFDDLERSLIAAKQSKNSVIVHVKTIKGNGYEPAQINKWHGVNPFDIKTGKSLTSKSGKSFSRLVADDLEYLMEKDEEIVVITPAMCDGSELNNIANHFPDRFTDVGIAEEHAITFSAALALAGKKPFCSIYSTFLQRSYDQIFHDIVRQQAPVLIGIDRAGIVGADGETHQGIYDLSFLLPMKDIVIAQANEENDIYGLLKWAINYDKPVAIRYPRGGSFNMQQDYNDNNFKPFTWKILKEHQDAYILSYGNQIDFLKQHIDEINCGIIDCIFLNPIDEQTMDKIKDKHLIIIEEHVEFGGFNTLIKNMYPNSKIDVIALPNQFIEQGSVDDLLKRYNLIGQPLLDKIESLLNNEN